MDLFEEYKSQIPNELKEGKPTVVFEEKYIENNEEVTNKYAKFESLDAFNKWVDAKYPNKRVFVALYKIIDYFTYVNYLT